jgi:NAD(P)-dependent dehydrogenase (short-subunit alcohol dehydrogenase family)
MSQRALVTGASRGMGKAIAVTLARAGYDVAITARTLRTGERRDNSISVHKTDDRPLPGSLEETAGEVRSAGQEALLLPFDLTDATSVQSAADQVLEEWGGVDVLVHNGRYVGPGLMDVFFDTPLDAYDKFLAAHLTAPLLLSRAFVPGMLERGSGTVVTITSNAAYAVPPGAAGQGGWGHAYAVGKAAGHQLVPTLHAEFAHRGLRCFNVEPGFVATERNRTVAADLGHDISQATPPEVIGSVVGWLVAEGDAGAYGAETVKAQDLARDIGVLPAHTGG